MIDAFDDRRVGVLGGLGLLPAERLSGVGRRVIAYLAVKGPSALRNLLCAELWPDLPDDRGRANLRRALWQLPTGWVSVDGPDLALDAEVDLHAALAAADRANAGLPLETHELRLLSRDLLPGWYEEWLVAEQQLFRLRRVQALETACRTAMHAGEHCLATQAGMWAITAEPLRESAVAALVEAHLHEGNRVEALRRYRSYEQLLHAEMAGQPGDRLRALVDQ